MSIAFFIRQLFYLACSKCTNIVSLQGGEDRIQEAQGEGEGVQ